MSLIRDEAITSENLVEYVNEIDSEVMRMMIAGASTMLKKIIHY